MIETHLAGSGVVGDIYLEVYNKSTQSHGLKQVRNIRNETKTPPPWPSSYSHHQLNNREQELNLTDNWSAFLLLMKGPCYSSLMFPAKERFKFRVTKTMLCFIKVLHQIKFKKNTEMNFLSQTVHRHQRSRKKMSEVQKQRGNP